VERGDTALIVASAREGVMRGAGSCGESLKKTASDRFSEPPSESRSRQLMTALSRFSARGDVDVVLLDRA
jgi:hypothetical protein